MEREIETLKPNLILNKLLLHIAFTLSIFTCFGQDLYNHELDEVKWQDIKDNIRYEGKDNIGESWTYENNEEYERALKRGKGKGGSGKGKKKSYTPEAGTTPEKQEDRQQNDWFPDFNPDFSGLSWLGWMFMILFGAALVGFIVYLIMNTDNTGAKKVAMDDYFENIAPADIPLTELEKRLKEALEQSNYRGAVRIYYLFILKDISIKEWVFWEKDKTNMHYLREMSGKAEFDDFNKAISYFEVIWYGKRQIDHSQFQTVQPYFTNLLQRLGVK